MADVMTVELDQDTAGAVRDAVTSGEYASAGAVVAAALHDWTARRDEWLGYDIDELRALGDEGEASGPGDLSLQDIEEESLRLAGRSNAGR